MGFAQWTTSHIPTGNDNQNKRTSLANYSRTDKTTAN